MTMAIDIGVREQERDATRSLVAETRCDNTRRAMCHTCSPTPSRSYFK